MDLSPDDDDGVRLYRAVSQEELDDIASFGGFRPGPGQLETKLFTMSADDAAFFAREILYPLDQRPLTILEVGVPDAFAERLFRFITDGKLTVAVDPSQLAELNAVDRIRVMHACPIP